MTVTFAEKLARMPHYEPGTSLDDAQARAETDDAVKLASNESPLPPHPAVVEAIAEAAGDVNRYPDPEARLLRSGIAERCETEPGQDRRLQRLLRDPAGGRRGALRAGRGDRLRVALVLDLPAHGRALGRARDPRPAGRWRGPRPRRDGGGDHRRDPDRGRLQSRTTRPAPTCPRSASAHFLESVPKHVTVILDEAYIEFQAVDHPDATIDLLPDYPNLVLLRTFSKCLRARGPPGRLRPLLAAVPRRRGRRAPALQRQPDRPGGGLRGDPPPG